MRQLAYEPWAQMTDDEKVDLIQHMKICCLRNAMLPGTRLPFVRDVCIPVLVVGHGRINEIMRTVEIAEGRGFSQAEIGMTIEKYHNQLKTQVTVRQAALIMKRSRRQVRRLAKKGSHHLDAKLGPHGWLINPVSVNDWWWRNNPHGEQA